VPASSLIEAPKWQMSISPMLPPQQFVDDKGELPEIRERGVPMRGDFAPVSLGVDDRAEGGEIIVSIDRRFVPAFALRADEARQDRPGKHSAAPATSYWRPRSRSTDVHFAPKRWPPRHLSGSA
jgi:hypothetical protein